MKNASYVLALLCVVVGVPTAFAVTAKPNVIVIYTDDHGYSDLGCMGIMNDVKTPNIDALARGGVRMTNGYVTGDAAHHASYTEPIGGSQPKHKAAEAWPFVLDGSESYA